MPEITDVAKRFAKDISDWASDDGKQRIRAHRMTILRDDGPYRHLRFASPDSGSYWFDLITWPGCLTIHGDMETFTFARSEDMFGFFRGSAYHGQINPQYWAEKLRAPRPQDVQVYSSDLFRECVMAEAKEAEADWPGLTDAVEEHFFSIYAEVNTEHEAAALEGLNSFEFHDKAAGETFTFTDTWEWHLRDWSYQYLWCCHAIVWAVAQYDKQKAPVAVGSNA